MFFKRLHALDEDQFAIFRTSFESRRQIPSSLQKGLLGGIFLQIVLSLCAYAVADPYMIPGYHKLSLLITQYTWSGILVLFTIPFLFNRVSLKKQSVQLLIGTIHLFNILCVFPLLMAFFLLVRIVDNLTGPIIFMLAAFAIITGILLYLIFLYRLIRGIEAGDYRKDSEVHDYDEALRKDRAVIQDMPKTVIAGTGLMFIFGSFLSTLDATLEHILLLLLFLALFYMGVVLSVRNTISIYCKWRFHSYNFDEDIQLHPTHSGDKAKK